MGVRRDNGKMGHVVNFCCGNNFNDLRALPKKGIEAFHFFHAKINSSRYLFPQKSP